MAYKKDAYDMFTTRVNEVARNYIEELKKEKLRVPDDLPMCRQLIDDAIDRIYETGRIPSKPFYADVYKQHVIKLCQKIYIPVKQYPTFNFKGKILGPKGNTLKRLHDETMCNIAIKGHTSMRDQDKEEELRQSGNPVFNHLNKPLYVELNTMAPPAECYARMAYALSEIRKYIVPDKNDEISQEQYRELMEINPDAVKKNFTRPVHQSVFGKLGLRGANGSSAGNNQESNAADEPVTPNRGPRAEPSTSYLAKTKNLRPQPYQKRPGPGNKPK